MKTLIIIALLFLVGCKATKFQQGTYRVESAKNYHGKSVVKLEGLNKEFVFYTDTLKRGDYVYFTAKPTTVTPIGQ